MTARAGIVLVTKFVASGSQVFSSYIDYIDRDEAIRNQEFENFTLFQEYVGSYMDDKEKTYGLFTAERQTLTPQAKQDLKDIYQTAQQKGSLMWQTVISFDNDFLAGNGLYDAKTGDIDEEKLREYTRKSMRVMLEKEGFPAPKFTVDESITDFYAFTKDSFRLENYQYHPFDFEIPMAI